MSWVLISIIINVFTKHGNEGLKLVHRDHAFPTIQ